MEAFREQAVLLVSAPLILLAILLELGSPIFVASRPIPGVKP